ncbi:MAG: molecular chaperone HtpG [Victivallales bacterium]|nr:molecular chaperone HtpG [Victivallales bacterium]
MSEQRAFKTEVQKLLDLVIHSLYSNKEIFLRELISNASDAIDRIRFQSLTNADLLEGDSDWKIKLTADKDAKTLTVSDNGIGMSEAELENNLGTIASSGTKKFLEELAKNKENMPPELIGQFGVGFYSAFMVGSEVTVITRQAGGQAFKWTSKGDGFYTIEPATREKRGTDVIVKLTEDNEEFLNEWKIRKTVERFSNYVEFPITMDIRREEPVLDKDGKRVEGAEPKVTITEETLNSQKAIWQKSKSEVTQDEYNEFYRHISHDFVEPLETIHWNVEGQTEFRALIFIPAKPIFDMFVPEMKDKGVQLYVRRVFITDKCDELVPSYLRFLRGVVDSSDLPLNVSREILQQNRTIRIIQKNLVKKVLDTLAEMKSKDVDKYLKFWDAFGPTLKEGLHMDFENKDRLVELLMFDSTATADSRKTSLEEYVSRMPEAQKEIYYLNAEDRAAAEKSPVLEAFKAKGYEVLFSVDAIDDWVMNDVPEYKGKSFRCISKGDVDLDSEDEKKAKEESRKQAEADNKDLLETIKELLKDKVADVKLSHRLTESACCLVGGEYSMGDQMAKIMKAMGQEVPDAKKILEVNPDHPLVAVMRKLRAQDAKSPKLEQFVKMLYGQAQLMAQIPLDDPLEFSKIVSNLLVADGENSIQ